MGSCIRTLLGYRGRLRKRNIKYVKPPTKDSLLKTAF